MQTAAGKNTWYFLIAEGTFVIQFVIKYLSVILRNRKLKTEATICPTEGVTSR